MSFAAPGVQQQQHGQGGAIGANEPLTTQEMAPLKQPSSLRLRPVAAVPASQPAGMAAPNASFCGGSIHHACLKCAHNNSIVVAPSVSSSYGVDGRGSATLPSMRGSLHVSFAGAHAIATPPTSLPRSVIAEATRRAQTSNGPAPSADNADVEPVASTSFEEAEQRPPLNVTNASVFGPMFVSSSSNRCVGDEREEGEETLYPSEAGGEPSQPRTVPPQPQTALYVPPFIQERLDRSVFVDHNSTAQIRSTVTTNTHLDCEPA